MKLLDAFAELENSLDILPKVIAAIDSRITWLEVREPESDGSVHDEWTEKYELLEEVQGLLSGLNSELPLAECEKITEDIRNKMLDYQLIYGGLSRISI